MTGLVEVDGLAVPVDVGGGGGPGFVPLYSNSDYLESIKDKPAASSLVLDPSFYAYDEYEVVVPERVERVAKPGVALSIEEAAAVLAHPDSPIPTSSAPTTPSPTTTTTSTTSTTSTTPTSATAEWTKVAFVDHTEQPPPKIDVLKFLNNLFEMIQDEIPRLLPFASSPSSGAKRWSGY